MLRSRLVTTAAVIGAAIGGGAIANAATSSTAATTSATPATQTGSAPQQARQTFPAHGTAAHEALEKPVTGANAAKAQAAAVKAVGSGSTAGEVTTDVSGNGYEVTVTKSDGSKVEVHLDGSFSLDDHGRLGG